MGKKNTTKLIVGILLIFIIVTGWLVLAGVVNQYKAGGGLILLIPLYMFVRVIWDSMVIQKPAKENNNKGGAVDAQGFEITENSINNPLLLTKIMEAKTLRDQENAVSTQKGNLIQNVFHFLTFQSPTFKSVFDEGQRRIVTIISLVLPVVASYGYFYDAEQKYLPDDWLVGILVFYLIFFIVTLLYIWVREGQGKARTGGSATKAFGSLIIGSALVALLIVGINYYYNEIYLVNQRRGRIEKVFKQFHQNLADEDWAQMATILRHEVDGQTQKAIIDDFKGKLSKIDIVDWEISDIRFISENEVEGIFSYTRIEKDKKSEKKIRVKMVFSYYRIEEPVISSIWFKDESKSIQN